MKLEIRQTSDRNGKLYEIRLHGQIVGDADDESTAGRVKDIIAAAFESHGELTIASRKAAENALREAHLENDVSLFWGVAGSSQSAAMADECGAELAEDEDSSITSVCDRPAGHAGNHSGVAVDPHGGPGGRVAWPPETSSGQSAANPATTLFWP